MSEVPAASRPDVKLSRKATWSFGLSLGGMFCLGPIASIPAIILGHSALSAIRKNDTPMGGRRLAISGLVIGYAALLLQALLLTGALFAEQLAYKMKCRANPPDYTFNISLSDSSASAEVVAQVLSRRLRNAEVPYNVEVSSSSSLTVAIAKDQGLPLDAARVLLTRPAWLTFRLVHEDNENLVESLFERRVAPEGYRIVQSDARLYFAEDPDFPETERTPEWRDRVRSFQVPSPVYEMLLEKKSEAGGTLYSPLFVKRRHELAGDSLKSASVNYNSFGGPAVAVSFNEKGAKKFAQITEDLCPEPGMRPSRRLAIVVDDTLHSAPTVMEPIYGGQAVISGSFTPSEATLLAAALTAGPLPCPVVITDESKP